MNNWINTLCVSLLTMLSTSVFAQIQGVVVDSSGEPLIGVNILLQGNDNVGTTSDISGNFSIDAKKGDVLVFSYIGFENKKVEISDILNPRITLVEASQVLDELVVVGYGAVGKKDLTGVFTKIGEDDFNQGVITAPETLLTGKVAGLQISNNGEPGGSSRIRLRGATSLDAGSDPLIVIDGVQMDNRGIASGRNVFNFVNPNDIEDITVLKDASAAAIYGARGANGVIIVTTKKGKEGGLQVDYSGQFSASMFSARPNIFNATVFRDAINDKAPQKLRSLGEAQTDWVEEVTQIATGLQQNIALSGGKGKSNYYISLGYVNNKGVLKTSSHENRSIGINLNSKLFGDHLEIGIKSKTSSIIDQFAPNVMGAAQAFDPTQAIFDEESPYGGYYQWNDPLAVNNPVSTLQLTDEQGNSVRSLNNLLLKLNIPSVEGLSITSNSSYDYITGDKNRLLDPLLKDGDNFSRGGFLFQEDLRTYTASFENYGTYKKSLPDLKSNFEFTLGHSYLETDQENRWTEGNQLMLQDNNEYIFTEDIKQDSFLVANKLVSFFSRLNYNYDEKYLFTFSLRRDGSSRFGEGNKWGLFPAAAFAWRILEEDFAQGLSNTFSNLKLRLSYGVTGNENIGDFRYNIFYGYGTDDARYQFGDRFINTLRGKGVDPNIKWEETTSINLGIDFGFLDGRISGSLDAYQKKTDDMLFTVAASAFTNLSDRILTNIGEMENKGIELGLNAVLYDQSRFGWDMSLNASYNKNTIVKLDNSNLPEFLGYETGGISGDIGQTIQILRVGQSIETFLTYRSIINPETGLPYTDRDDRNGNGLLEGIDMYEDINEDGLINESDLVVGQNALPDFMFGWTNNVRYGGFDLAMTMRANLGNYVYNNVKSSTGYFERLSDRVPNNIDRSAYTTNFTERQLKSDYYIENASFLKLDNISLGYNLGKKSIFDRLRIFTTVQNVFTLSGYSGLDPELPQFSGGIDNNLYPISRTFLLGLNASF